MAMAMVFNVDGKTETLTSDFDVNDSERKQVNKTVTEIEKILSNKSNLKSNIVLASLSEISKKHIKNLKNEIKTITDK